MAAGEPEANARRLSSVGTGPSFPICRQYSRSTAARRL